MTFDLNTAIRAALDASESPDPHVIAAALAPTIPADALRDVVAALLPHAVREVVRQRRGTAPVPDATPPSVPGTNGKRGLAGLTNDIWRMPYFVANKGWVFYGDLTVADVEAIAHGYEQRAAESATHSKRFRTLANEMKRAGARTVRDLGNKALEAAA